MKPDRPYWPAALRLGQAASYCGLSVHMLKAVCPIKPIEFTQSSRGAAIGICELGPKPCLPEVAFTSI
ncbi:hypothetical protein IVB38_34525 [Bradyrhizobium sp. 38]|uniref:hypothetical protein n=1 Tax=unclassified Bradyrhizobium TaxID=2631580 RepID=UPI001FF88D25|nr:MULTISPECIES: hypothetical protein [unclassified Bradyrhizobium]MCK1340998.1 hypothetical protein [Bradyrhizobium sp. 38]MCK1781288.1 hypothetical protein [Bradyrhizobium sp. 132]